MPEPSVDVATGQPQVDERMPEPQVRIERSGQQADVQVSHGQPEVRYERTGEPRVIVNQSDGQPQVRYIILSHGGFLGMFKDKVAIPAERFLLQGDHLRISGVTEDDLEQMSNFSERQSKARRLRDRDQLQLIVAQQ